MREVPLYWSRMDLRLASPLSEQNALYTLHPTPCTLHPTPCILHPASCTLHPTPCTLHPETVPLQVGWADGSVRVFECEGADSSLLWSARGHNGQQG